MQDKYAASTATYQTNKYLTINFMGGYTLQNENSLELLFCTNESGHFTLDCYKAVSCMNAQKCQITCCIFTLIDIETDYVTQ